eukprot:scaffold42531_cov61-Phaeocystis_antarctica.AAC.1
MPPDAFALYYRSKQLEGGAALSSWGVGKGATIEVKTRGRGGARQAQGGASPKEEKEEKGAEMAAKAIADEAEDADASLASKVWAIGGRVLDADNESNECVPLSLAAVFLEAMRRTELSDHLFSGALAAAHDGNVDGGMHELRSALEKLAARPLDAGIRSMGSVPTLAIRNLVSKLCAAEPKEMTSQWYVSSEEAARVAVPSTTVPLGAVVALLQKLPVRVALFVHWGDHVERHDFGGSVEAPFVGGLLAREGHMSFVECDGAREHECDGALAEPTSEPLGLWEHEPVSSPHALVRLPDARVLEVPLECPADLFFDACKAHYGSPWVTLRYVLDARPFDEQRHQGTTIGELLGLREGGTLSVLQGMVLGAPTERVAREKVPSQLTSSDKRDKTSGGRDGEDRFHLEFCHTLSWELLGWIDDKTKLLGVGKYNTGDTGSLANYEALNDYDKLCYFMNSRGVRIDGKDDENPEARGNGRMKPREAESMLDPDEVRLREALGNVGGIGTLSDTQLDEYIFAQLQSTQLQSTQLQSTQPSAPPGEDKPTDKEKVKTRKIPQSVGFIEKYSDLSTAWVRSNLELDQEGKEENDKNKVSLTQTYFKAWCNPHDKLDDWNTIDALGIERKWKFLNALWQQAATRAHEQAHVLVHGSRRKYYDDEINTPMPDEARNTLLAMYSKLNYFTNDDNSRFVFKNTKGEWVVSPLRNYLTEVYQKGVFSFVYRLAMAVEVSKDQITPKIYEEYQTGSPEGINGMLSFFEANQHIVESGIANNLFGTPGILTKTDKNELYNVIIVDSDDEQKSPTAKKNSNKRDAPIAVSGALTVTLRPKKKQKQKTQKKSALQESPPDALLTDPQPLRSSQPLSRRKLSAFVALAAP